MTHWNDPPAGETPHCPGCGQPQAWDAPLYCDRCRFDSQAQYEPIEEPDVGGRCHR